MTLKNRKNTSRRKTRKTLTINTTSNQKIDSNAKVTIGIQEALLGGIIGFVMSNYIPVVIKYIVATSHNKHFEARDFSPEFDAVVVIASAFFIFMVIGIYDIYYRIFPSIQYKKTGVFLL